MRIGVKAGLKLSGVPGAGRFKTCARPIEGKTIELIEKRTTRMADKDRRQSPELIFFLNIIIINLKNSLLY